MALPVIILHPPFEKLVSGVKGAEGPVFTKAGAFYMVAPEVEVEGQPAGQILAVDLQLKETSVLCVPSVHGYGGIPAGCQCDKDGNLWVADMRLGILKVAPTGEFSQIATEDSNGRTVQGCNDCSFDPEGNLWVTAPAGNIAPEPYRRSMEEPFGSVYCFTAEHCLVRVITGLRFPNGIAIQRGINGKKHTLIVAETPTKTLWGFHILDAGQVDLESRFVWGKIPGSHEGGPDGMDFDCEGNLLVANWGAQHIEVFQRTGGEPAYRIACPFTRPSNMHFKPNSKDVYVTEHDSHSLWKFTWQHAGEQQFCQT